MSTQPSLQQLARVLGAKIRQLRKKKGWTQSEFADACRIHRSHMGKIERGEANVRLSTLVVIAEILEVKVEKLLTGAEEPRTMWT